MPKQKFVIVVGGGKTGSSLAGLLLKAGCEVRVLENRQPIFHRLAQELPAGTAILGDGTDPGLLEQVGIANADVLAAVTGDDEANLVAASVAKFEYQVERVIMRINNPRNAWLCTPAMGVDIALNQSDLMASMILEEMAVSDLQTLARLRQGSVEVVEEHISPASQAINKTLAALNLPPECSIMAIIRGGKVIIPKGSTAFQADDEVLAVIQADKRQLLQKLLE